MRNVNSELVLFLDFDDVICLNKTGCGYDTLQAIKQVERGERPSLDDDGFKELWARLFDAYAKEHLRLLHVEFSPCYVLSTSWRKFMEKETIVAVLQRCGLAFVADNLHPHWETSSGISNQWRAREISNWLGKNVEFEGRWIVLDDEFSGTGFAEWPVPEHVPFIVLCRENVGITKVEFLKLRAAFQARLADASNTKSKGGRR